MNVRLIWLLQGMLCELQGIFANEGLVESSHSGTWSVKIHLQSDSDLDYQRYEDLDSVATLIADEIGAENLGQVGELKGYYLMKAKNSDFHLTEKHILNHESISWHNKQSLLKRVKRQPPSRGVRIPEFLMFKDPLYKEQWHLQNNRAFDCNVTGVWSYNITGKGVVVAVVDDGVEWRHPDLIKNYCKEGSFDLKSNDDDPTPSYDEEEENKHGTRCAGEIAAVPNSICGVGIAFESKFSGIRVLDGTPTTDSTEATAFNKHMDINDVYSCSWGPEDDGKTVDGPHPLGKLALQHGVVAGRNGFGSIFVVASGNGGELGDNCNYDGYANSIYTITVGAIDEFGRKPHYSEECTSMIAGSLSSGDQDARSVVTTDWSLPPGNSEDQCTRSHSGTSAATPLAAGMIALMLQVRPCLIWRDLQHIIVMTAMKVDEVEQWTENKAGFVHSDSHGFGLLNAWRLVNAAKVWRSVPWLTSFSPDTDSAKNIEIPCCKRKPLILEVKITSENCETNMLSTLEHIDFHVNLKHYNRGKLQFSLTCPSGTMSKIPTRPNDISDKGLDWTFSTVKCWGEKPVGTYTLKIIDTSHKLPSDLSAGTLTSWKLTVYGSQWTAKDMVKRRELVVSSFSGVFLNSSGIPCPPGETLDFDVTTAPSESTIKLVTMLSCFFAFWAIYYTIEIAFCDADGKKKAHTGEDLTQQNDVENPETSETFLNSTFSGDNEDVLELTVDSIPKQIIAKTPGEVNVTSP